MTDSNPNLWVSDTLDEQVAAAAKCLDCPFMTQCAEDGKNEAYGVWGGVTEWERPQAKADEVKRLKAAAAAELRERDATIALMYADGNTQQAIADSLRISRKTVDRSLARERKRHVGNALPALIAA